MCNLWRMPHATPFPAFPIWPLPPQPPLELAMAPRPWLSRERGECAFPVAGESWTTVACCNPCGGACYCPVHRELMLRTGG